MIEKNDPRLTDFVLGELDANESATISAAIENSDELRQAVAEIEQTTQMLGQAFDAEPALRLSEQQRQALLSAAAEPGLSKPEPSAAFQLTPNRFRWLISGVAAAVVCMIGGVIYFSDAFAPSISFAKKESAPTSIKSDQKQSVTDSLELDSQSIAKSKLDELPGRSQDESKIRPLVASPQQGQDALLDSTDIRELAVLDKANRKSPDSESTSAETEADKALKLSKAETLSDTKDLKFLQMQPEVASNSVTPMTRSNAAEFVAPKSETSLGLPDFSPDAIIANQQKLAEMKWQSMLNNSKLGPLQLRVKTKAIDWKQEIDQPQQRFVQRNQIHFYWKEGAEKQKEISVLSPTEVLKSQMVTFRFLKPVATLHQKEAEQIIQQLAAQVDPDNQKELSMESLLGFEDSIVQLDSDQDHFDEMARLAAAAPARGLNAGQFSLPEPANENLTDVATHELLQLLRRQLAQQIIEEEKLASLIQIPGRTTGRPLNESPVARGLGGGLGGRAGVDLAARKSKRSETMKQRGREQSQADIAENDDSKELKLAASDSPGSGSAGSGSAESASAESDAEALKQSRQSLLSKPAPLAGSAEQATMIVRPLGQQSVAQFDFTEIFSELKTALKKRNANIKRAESKASEKAEKEE